MGKLFFWGGALQPRGWGGAAQVRRQGGAALRDWHSDLAFDWQGSKWQQLLEAFGSDPDGNTHG